MSLVVRIGFLVGMLGLGVLGRRLGLLPVRVTERLNSLAFYVVLPALIFDSTYDVPLATLLSPAVVLGQLLVMTAIVTVAWLLHSRIDVDRRRGVAMVQSYHGNLGYLGLPIVAASLGSTAAGTASVILGVGVLTQVPLTVFFLTVVAGAETVLRREVGRVLHNPVLLSLGAGLGVSYFEFDIPGLVARSVGALGSIALPLALLLVGASLRSDLPDGEFGTLGTVVGLKLLGMPAIAWLIYSALEVTEPALAAGVVMFGAPTAISTYIYTKELGGDARLASRTIFASTLVWTVTVFGLLELVG